MNTEEVKKKSNIKLKFERKKIFVAQIVRGTRNPIQSERTSVEYVEQRRNIMAALCRSISSDPIEMKQKMISVSIVCGSVCAHSTHSTFHLMKRERKMDGHVA